MAKEVYRQEHKRSPDQSMGQIEGRVRSWLYSHADTERTIGNPPLLPGDILLIPGMEGPFEIVSMTPGMVVSEVARDRSNQVEFPNVSDTVFSPAVLVQRENDHKDRYYLLFGQYDYLGNRGSIRNLSVQCIACTEENREFALFRESDSWKKGARKYFLKTVRVLGEKRSLAPGAVEHVAAARLTAAERARLERSMMSALGVFGVFLMGEALTIQQAMEMRLQNLEVVVPVLLGTPFGYIGIASLIRKLLDRTVQHIWEQPAIRQITSLRERD